MKSKSAQYIIGALVLALLLGGVAYALSGPDTEEKVMTQEKEDAVMMEKKDAAMMDDGKDGAMMKNEDSMMMSPMKGSFVPYEASLVSKASPDNKIVLFFNASWCPTCKAAAASLRSSGVPDGVTVLSVDYDTNLELRQEHGVTYQHTFVQVDASGTQLAKWSGSVSGAEIAAKVI